MLGTLQYQNSNFTVNSEYIELDKGLSITGIDFIQEEWNLDDLDLSLIKREFRWSRDGKEFSNFMPLEIEFLNSLQVWTAAFNLQFRFTLLDDLPVPISLCKLSIGWITKENAILDFPIEYLKENCLVDDKQLSVLSNTNNLCNPTFKPYQQKEITNLQQDLSTMVAEMFGIDVTYIKADPNVKSKDTTLLEWGLLEYQDPKPFKINVPDNQFPDMKWDVNLYGIEFEIPFEVHIDKIMFQKTFGWGEAPQQDDIIHIPMLNRMYIIQSMTPHYDVMMNPLYYKVNLVKARKRGNISVKTEFEGITDKFIEDITTNTEELFGKEIKDEKIRTVNKHQSKDKTSQQGHGRKLMYDDRVCIFYENLYFQKSLLSRTHYDFTNILDTEYWKPACVYDVSPELLDNNNYTFTCWYNIPTRHIKEYKVLDITKTENSIIFKVEFLPNVNLLKEGQNVMISDENNFYYGGLISYNRNKKTIEIEFNETLYFQNSKMFLQRTNKTLWLMQKKNIISSDYFEINILSGLNNAVLEIFIGDDVNYYNIGGKTNSWNGIVVKYLPNFLNVLSVERFTGTSSEPEFKEERQLEIKENIIVNQLCNQDEYKLLVSDLKLCNLTLYNRNFDESDSLKLIKQYILQNANFVLFNDLPLIETKDGYVGLVK